MTTEEIRRNAYLLSAHFQKSYPPALQTLLSDRECLKAYLSHVDDSQRKDVSQKICKFVQARKALRMAQQ